MTQVYNTPVTRAWTNLGKIGVGYQKFFYEKDTTTKKSIFAEEALITPLTNPVIADANGYFPQIFMQGTGDGYKAVLTDANDTDPPTSPIWTANPVEVDANDINAFGTRPAQHWGTTTNTAVDYQITPITALNSYTTDLLFSLEAHIANTGAGTLAVADLNNPGSFLTALGIKKYDGAGAKIDIEAGDLQGSQTYIFRIDSVNAVLLNPKKPFIDLSNTTLATQTTKGIALLPRRIQVGVNSGDESHDIDFSAGVFQFDDGTGQTSATALTKRIDSIWVAGNNQGGLDTGSVASNTYYYLFAIYDPTNDITDFLFSTSKTNPTLPTNYTKQKRIGSLRTEGSANIRAFDQQIDRFIYRTYIQDRTISAAPTSPTNLTLTVPPNTIAINNLHLNLISIANTELLFCPTNNDSLSANTTNFTMRFQTPGGDQQSFSQSVETTVDSLSHVNHDATVGQQFQVLTTGYIDWELSL